MDWFLKLGFFSMTDKVTDAIGGAMPYIITGAVIVAIWIYFLFLVPKKDKRYDSVSDYLNDVLNFRLMLSSGLVKILYIASAIVVLVVGLVAIFAANFLVGLLGTIILEIVLRVLFEVFMVVFSIQENVTTIKEKQHEDQESDYYYED
jgi:type II secretory pathway component PulF